jgi:hypothetical protein
MHRVSRAELEEWAPAWDAVASADAAVDAFCARSAWQLAFHDAFEPGRSLLAARDDTGVVVLAESHRAAAPGLLEPLENMWGFACPLAGAGAPALLARALIAAPRPVLLLGLPREPRRWAELGSILEGRFGARRLEPTERYVASLEGGFEGWLGRRSPSFRRNLRQSLRRVAAAGISFRRVRLPGPDAGSGGTGAGDDALARLYAAVLDVEGRSWKGRAGRGADREPMRSFYAGLWPRLAREGSLRVLLAERSGVPVGYLHGALVGRHFRGLQFSFDDAWRPCGLGNALQAEMLRWLVDEGARSYDLGGQSDYKARWAERAEPLLGVLLVPLGR